MCPTKTANEQAIPGLGGRSRRVSLVAGILPDCRLALDRPGAPRMLRTDSKVLGDRGAGSERADERWTSEAITGAQLADARKRPPTVGTRPRQRVLLAQAHGVRPGRAPRASPALIEVLRKDVKHHR